MIKTIESSNKPGMQRYLRTYAIEVDKCSNSYIRKWNVNVLEIYKKAEKEEVSDIILFFNRI